MALWNAAYEEASANLKNSPRSCRSQLSPHAPRPSARLRELVLESEGPSFVSTAAREEITEETMVVCVGGYDGSRERKNEQDAMSVLVPSQAPVGRSQLVGFDRRVVTSRSSSPVSRSLHPAVDNHTAVGQSLEIEDMMRSRVGCTRCGLLSLHAIERGARWGSLRSSWLVRNTFQSWRECSTFRHLNEGTRMVVIQDFDRIRDLEDIIAEKDRSLLCLEERLAEIGEVVAVERTRHSEILGTLNAQRLEETKRHSEILDVVNDMGLKPELGRVLDALSQERVDEQKRHSAVMTGQSSILDRVRESILKPEFMQELASIRSEIKTSTGRLDQNLQDLQAASRDQSRALSQCLADSERMTRTVVRELLNEVRTELVDAGESLAEKSRGQLVNICQETERNISAALLEMGGELRQEMSSARSEVRHLKEEMKDMRVALSGLRDEVGRHDPERIVSAVSGVTQGIIELTGIVQSTKPDYTQVLRAIQELRIPDHSDVLAAISQLKASSDVSGLLTEIRNIDVEPDLSSMKVAVNAAQSRVIEAIEYSTARITQAVDSVNLKPSLESLSRAIASAEVDFAPVLNSIQDAKADIHNKGTAVLAELFRTQRQFLLVEQRATLVPAFGAWRQAATRSSPTISPLSLTQQQAVIPFRRAVSPRAVSPQAVVSTQNAAPQSFAFAGAAEECPTRASSSGVRTMRFVSGPALSPRRDTSYLMPDSTVHSTASAVSPGITVSPRRESSQLQWQQLCSKPSTGSLGSSTTLGRTGLLGEPFSRDTSPAKESFRPPRIMRAVSALTSSLMPSAGEHV